MWRAKSKFLTLPMRLFLLILPLTLLGQPDLAFLPHQCGYKLINDSLYLYLVWENQGNETIRTPYAITIVLADYENAQTYYLELNRSITTLGLPGELAPGERISFVKGYDLVQFDVKKGKLDIVVQLDPLNQIPEVVERSNNVWSLTDWIPYQPQWSQMNTRRTPWIRIQNVQLKKESLQIEMHFLRSYPLLIEVFGSDGSLFYHQTLSPLWPGSLFHFVPLPETYSCYFLVLSSGNEILLQQSICKQVLSLLE